MIPRFRKVMRERKLRDGSFDRFWCVLDREQRDFIVLRVCASYPGAELIAGAYALKLNVKLSTPHRSTQESA